MDNKDENRPTLNETQTARSMNKCNSPFDEDKNHTNEEMLAELERALDHDGDCKALLFAQAHVLNSMFHRAIDKALTSPKWSGGKSETYIDDERINLALRSQRQCRSTIEALANIKSRPEKTPQKIPTNELKDHE